MRVSLVAGAPIEHIGEAGVDFVGGGVLDNEFLFGMGLEDQVPVLVQDALDDVRL